MDSDFNAPSSEPVKSDSGDESKTPETHDHHSSWDSHTSDVDSSESIHDSDEPMMSNDKDTHESMEEHHHTSDSDNKDWSKSDMSTDSDSSAKAPVIIPPVKINGAHKYIYGYVGLIILVAAVVGVYVWQHNKVSALNAHVVAVNAELSAQQKRVYSLESQLSKADSEIASFTPATLGLTVVKATHYTPSGTNSAKNSGVAVDVSIKNPTSKAVSLVTSTFKLKDAQSNSYTATNFPAQSTDSSLPSGYSLLIDQSIAPGATVSGTLEFGVPTTTLTAFTLIYNSQSEVVTVTSN